MHPLRELDCPQFWNDLRYLIKMFGFRGHLQRNDLPTEFNKDVLVDSKVVGGGVG
jgi:hypothetical protein